jgi:hypothetical protein
MQRRTINRFYPYPGPNGEPGLRCDCGNSEFLTETKGEYESFGYWQSRSTAKFEGHCAKCNSPVHEIHEAPTSP